MSKKHEEMESLRIEVIEMKEQVRHLSREMNKHSTKVNTILQINRVWLPAVKVSVLATVMMAALVIVISIVGETT